MASNNNVIRNLFIGANFGGAITASQPLNSGFIGILGKSLMVLGTNTPFSDFLEVFTQEILSPRKVNGQSLSANTLIGYDQRINIIREEWETRNIDYIQLKEVAIKGIMQVLLILVFKEHASC